MENIIVYTERENYPKEYVSQIEADDYVEIESSEDLRLRIYPITKHIVRLRYSIDGHFDPDFSYALDEKFKPNKVDYIIDERGSEFILKTSALQCVINKQNLKVLVNLE